MAKRDQVDQDENLSVVASLSDGGFDLTNLPFLSVEDHRTEAMELGDPKDRTRPYIRVTGGDYGIASKRDGKILNALRSEISSRKISGCTIQLSADDLLLSSGFATDAEDWKRLQEALLRIKSTDIFATAYEGEGSRGAAVGYFSSYVIISDEATDGEVQYRIKITLNSWFREKIIDPNQLISTDPAHYFGAS